MYYEQLFSRISSASLVCWRSYVVYIANNMYPDQTATFVTLSSIKKSSLKSIWM